LCLYPVKKSFGSCAGVTLTTPVPKFISTNVASHIIGNVVYVNGENTLLP